MGRLVFDLAVSQLAECLLFDIAAETTFPREFMKSKSRNTPFLDQALKGRVDLVILGTKILLER